MTLQHVPQAKAHFAQLVTAGLLMLQAAIATTAISAFSTQSVSAQAVNPKAQSIEPFETKQLNIAAKDVVPSQAAACWTNAASPNCSYIISPSQRLSLSPVELPNGLNTATMLMPVSAATCWTGTASQACSYTIRVSQSDRINPFPSQQFSELPNFNPPLDRVILVRVQF